MREISLFVTFFFTLFLFLLFTARRNALRGLSYRNSVRPSVCDSTYDDDFFTMW